MAFTRGNYPFHVVKKLAGKGENTSIASKTDAAQAKLMGAIGRQRDTLFHVQANSLDVSHVNIR